MKSTMSLFLVSIFSLASGINNAEDCKPAIPLKDNTPFPAIFAVFVSDTLPDVPKSLRGRTRPDAGVPRQCSPRTRRYGQEGVPYNK